MTEIRLDINEVSTASWVLTQISSHPLLGIPKVESLDGGDVWLLDDNPEPIIVERKSPEDLLASIADNRLSNQCAKMVQYSSRCVLLITGQLPIGYDNKIIGTKWPANKIDSELFQVQEFGVKICHCLNDTEYSNKLAWLLNRQWTEHVILPPKKTGIPMPDDQRVLCSLPGIGFELSWQLLKERNLRDALLCLLDPTCKVTGIGDKTKLNIRQLFNLTDNEKLGVITND